MGLEQGFTLSSRHPGHGEASLRLDLSVAGDLSPQLTGDGDTILFLDGDGVPKLSYGSLYTYDATGRELPSELSLRDGGVAILVDDANAVYPVTVDPFIQQAKLTAGDGVAGDWFGFSVAISGDTAVIGALHHDDPNNDQGSAYVFVRTGGTWSQKAKLTASDGAGGDPAGDQFGFSVAISGDTAVIGALGDDDTLPGFFPGGGVDSGSAYVFVKPAGGWNGSLTETAKLRASDVAAGDHFGISVAISGDTVVIGARDAAGLNQARFRQGTAYVFVKPLGGWSGSLFQTTKLSPQFGQMLDRFGVSVAIAGDTVVVGAVNDDVGVFASGVDQGSAYVFVKPADGWIGFLKSTATLTAQDGAAADQFGTSVAIDGDTIVAGALNDDIGTNVNQGSAYVFVKPAGGWSTTSNFTAKLTAQDGAGAVVEVEGDQFGSSVAIAGDTAVVGAPSDDDKGIDSGSAYVFVKPAGGWSTTSNSYRQAHRPRRRGR